MQSRSLLRVAVCSMLLAPDLRALQTVVPPSPACDRYVAAVQADSTNLDAAARLGRCSFDDWVMIAPGGDSTRLMFRSSWSIALRALRHAVELAPTYRAAYRPLFAILFAETRDGCSSVTGECWFVSPVKRDGDSVITIPRLVDLNVPGVDTYDEVARESRASSRASLEEARALAERWVAAAPNDRRSHEYLGRALLILGDHRAASVQLERAATLGTVESRRALFWERFEALVKSDLGNDARRVLDEAVADPGRDTAQLRHLTIASLNALLGRYRPPPVDFAPMRQFRAEIDSLVRLHPPTTAPEPGFSELLAAGDTVGARRALVRMDSAMAPPPNAMRIPPVGTENFWSANYHVALGDTAGAEAQLAEIEGVLEYRPFQYSPGMVFSDPRPWMGHAWLLAGDLAARRGKPEEAARMYRRVIGLWGGGDPDLNPVVDRARAALDSLSRRTAPSRKSLETGTRGYPQAGWPGSSGMQPTYFPGTIT